MKFFGFNKKNKLGVDIGTASIKIVELAKEANRFRLQNYGLFELESGDEAFNSANPGLKTNQLSEDDVAWGIRETIKQSKMTATDAVVSIPSFSTFATVITMPYLSEEDIAKTIPYEARRYVPVPMSEVILDWSIISVAQNGTGQTASASRAPTVEVFIAAVPKDEAQRYQAIAKKANLNLRALELENSALIRALIGNDLSSIAIINIGGRSTSILIVDGGFERISHNYEVGGFEVTKSIATALKINLKRAEELKRSLGLKEDTTILNAMSSLVDMMAFETKKTIHNYEDLKQTKIGKVILVGGLANMPKFVEYFSGKLGMAVSLGNPLARIVYPPSLESLRPEINSTFTIALGLGMREI